MKRFLLVFVATLAGSLFAMAVEPERYVQEKIPIKTIMQKAHQPDRAARKALDQRVIDGKATDAEKKQLLELYEDLAQSVPAKGDLESWKKLTAPIVDAARGVVKGDEKAPARLAAALDCKACHTRHRK